MCVWIQYEGAAKEDGKGPSMWDYYTHKYPGLSSFLSLRTENAVQISPTGYKKDEKITLSPGRQGS